MEKIKEGIEKIMIKNPNNFMLKESVRWDGEGHMTTCHICVL